jgi:RNA polymerase sigma factor (sigma-70 family)
MDELSDRERRVIEARYFECVSLADIAKEFGLLSSERIRQIEAKALRKLRRPKRIENIERFSELLEA